MGTKVVITGIGVVSPVGNTIKDFWENLCNGKSGIRRVDDVFDPSRLTTQIAGIAPDFEPKDIPKKDLRRYDRFSLCAIEAADQAWAQSGMDISQENPFRVGTLIGTGIGGIKTIDENTVKNYVGGPRRISPLMVPTGISNMAAGQVAMRFGLQGPNKCVVTACASSTHALGDAADLIRLGKADVMVAGGTESTIFEFGIGGFAAMRALSTRNDEPERASRPFDLDRDGFVMGEGSGIMILESEEHARARGAEILGVVAGMGETCDAYHITAPRPDGSGGAQAMLNALHQAQLNKEDVDYYNAHGTSTKLNEISEYISLRNVFGDDMPPVSSTKSMTGHLLGAAGAVEALACLLAIRTGILPPNINYETPDPECPVNIVANESREANVEIAMSNSLGFGGHNACIIIQKYDA